MPSLYPVQFPFRIQYSILAETQKLLEECCYDFTHKYAPNLLADKKWDCAEAIELNKWTLTVIKRYGKLPAGAFKKSDYNVHGVLLAVNKLRHSAVHRLRISAKGIVQMVDAAVKFAETLLDSVRASQLEELYKELQSKIKSQELNKNYLETKLKDELDEIECQREELAKREREAVSTMVIEDMDNMHFIGSLLEDNLRNILDRDNKDELNGSDPNDQLDNAKAEVTDEDNCKEESPKEPESPKLVSNTIRSSEATEGEKISMNAAKEGLTEKENSSRSQDVKLLFDYKSIEFTNSPLAFSKFRKFEDDHAEKPSPEEVPIAEPTVDVAELSFAPVNEQPMGEFKSIESATEILPEVEPLADEPLKLAVQYVSIADAIQDVLKSKEIDTSYLRRKKGKAKKKLHRHAYDREMTKIKEVVSENLRRELENVRDTPACSWGSKKDLLIAYRVHLKTLF